MTRFSSLCKLAACLLWLPLGSCQRTHTLRFETAPLESEQPRQAPAVAVDPAPALPEPELAAQSESGLVVLEAPQNQHGDQALVEQFFDAVTERDIDKLEPLFEVGAKTRTTARGTEVDALDAWKSRLSRLDYSKLDAASVYRAHAVEVYRQQDLDQLGAERNLPVSVREDQIAIRVPLNAPQGTQTRLFGSEMVFLLAPTTSGLRIVEIVEDFQLP